MLNKKEIMHDDPVNAHHLYNAMVELSKVDPSVFTDHDQDEFHKIPTVLKHIYLTTGRRYNYWSALKNTKSYIKGIKTVIKGINKILSIKHKSPESMYTKTKQLIKGQGNYAVTLELMKTFNSKFYVDTWDSFTNETPDGTRIVPDKVYISLGDSEYQLGNVISVSEGLHDILSEAKRSIWSIKNHCQGDMMVWYIFHQKTNHTKIGKQGQLIYD